MTDPADGTSSLSLARSLAPSLVAGCDGRLGEIRWFRTDWQRGGAGTGFAAWHDADGATIEVVVKFPVPGRELRWFRRLGDGDAPPVARLFASGDELGGRDLAWIVIERLPFGPLSSRWSDAQLDRLADAAARFQARAAAFPVDREPEREEWPVRLSAARKQVHDPTFPLRSRWVAALKEAERRLDAVLRRWDARGPLAWLHGDLHPANAMSRAGLEEGPATLIDLGEVRPGHWVEDGVYLERLLWTKPSPRSPLRSIADARKRHGLENGEWAPLAACRRFLLAATAPAFPGERSAAFLAANLDRLEASFRDVPKG